MRRERCVKIGRKSSGSAVLFSRKAQHLKIHEAHGGSGRWHEE